MKKTRIDYLGNYMIIEDCNSIYRVNYQELHYIIHQKPYTVIYTNQGKELYIFYPIKNLIKYLPLVFAQCNKSTIINMTHFKVLEKKQNKSIIVLESGISFVISKRRINDVKNKIKLNHCFPI